MTNTLAMRMLALGPIPILDTCPPSWLALMEPLVEDGRVVVVKDAIGRRFWVLADSPDRERLEEQASAKRYDLAGERADAEADRAESDFWRRDI